MQKGKLSIIVPVYNTEKYLDKCIESLVNQTYKNIEILLIDDGSTDNSFSLCERWRNADNRIKCVSKVNGGASSARNLGLTIASGDMITFVDSDDWVEKEAFEIVVNDMCNTNADMLIYGITYNDEFDNVIEERIVQSKSVSEAEIELSVLGSIKNDLFGYSANKIYKTELVKMSKVQYDEELIKQEDLVFNLCLVPYIKRLAYSAYAGYHYLQRKDSLIHSKEYNGIESILKYCSAINSVNMNDVAIRNKIQSYCIKHYISDCIIREILWNETLLFDDKIKLMNQIFKSTCIGAKLIKDKKEPLYLKALSKSFDHNTYVFFYFYYLISEIKRVIISWFNMC